MDKEHFGQLLTELRIQKGINQKALAEKLSVSTSAVSKWEHGKNLPDMTMISQIAEIFQVSCDALHNPEQTLDEIRNQEHQQKGEIVKEQRSKKGKWYKTAVIFAILVVMLVSVVGWYLYQRNQSKPHIQQVGTRYIDDPVWGNVYEIACVVDKEISLDEINVHLDEVRVMLKQEGGINTQVVKVSYYDSEENAVTWKETDVGGYVFLDAE